MATSKLVEGKTSLIAWSAAALTGAVVQAISEGHGGSVPAVAIPALLMFGREVATHMTAAGLHGGSHGKGSPRDILKNEHLTRAVGQAVAALIDQEAAGYPDDKATLEDIARYVNQHWTDIPVLDDPKFVDVSGFELPRFLTGDGQSFLKVPALSQETWRILLQSLSGMQLGHRKIVLAADTVNGLAETLRLRFATALFDILAADAAGHREAYAKIVLLMLGEILATSRATSTDVGDVLIRTEAISTDTGDILVKCDDIADRLAVLHVDVGEGNRVTWELLHNVLDLLRQQSARSLLGDRGKAHSPASSIDSVTWNWIVNLAFGFASFVNLAAGASRMDDTDFATASSLVLEPCQKLSLDCGSLPSRSELSTASAVAVGNMIEEQLQHRESRLAASFAFLWQFLLITGSDSEPGSQAEAQQGEGALVRLAERAALIDDFSKRAIHRLAYKTLDAVGRKALQDEFISWARTKERSVISEGTHADVPTGFSEIEIRLSDNWPEFMSWIRSQMPDMEIESVEENKDTDTATFAHSGKPGQMYYNISCVGKRNGIRCKRHFEIVNEWLHPLALSLAGPSAGSDWDTSLFPVYLDGGQEAKVSDPIARLRDCNYWVLFRI